MLRDCQELSSAHANQLSPPPAAVPHGHLSPKPSVSLPSITNTYHLEPFEPTTVHKRAASAEASASLSTNSSGVGDFLTQHDLTPLSSHRPEHYPQPHQLAELTPSPPEKIAFAAVPHNLSATFDISLLSPLRSGGCTDVGNNASSGGVGVGGNGSFSAGVMSGATTRPRFAQTPQPIRHAAVSVNATAPLAVAGAGAGTADSVTSYPVIKSPLLRGGRLSPNLAPAPPPPPPPVSTTTRPPYEAAGTPGVKLGLRDDAVCEKAGEEEEDERWLRPTPPTCGNTALYRPLHDSFAPVLKVTFEDEEEEEEEEGHHSLRSTSSDPSITTSAALNSSMVATASAPASFYRHRLSHHHHQQQPQQQRSKGRERVSGETGDDRQTPPSSDYSASPASVAAAAAAAAVAPVHRHTRLRAGRVLRGGEKASQPVSSTVVSNTSHFSSSLSGATANAATAAAATSSTSSPAAVVKHAGRHVPLPPPPEMATTAAAAVVKPFPPAATRSPSSAEDGHREKLLAWGEERKGDVAAAGDDREKEGPIGATAATTAAASPPRLVSATAQPISDEAKRAHPPRSLPPSEAPPVTLAGSLRTARTASRVDGAMLSSAARSATSGFTTPVGLSRMGGVEVDRCAASLPPHASPFSDALETVPVAEKTEVEELEAAAAAQPSNSGNRSDGGSEEDEEEYATGNAAGSSDFSMDRLFYRVMEAKSREQRKEALLTPAGGTPATSSASSSSGFTASTTATAFSGLPRAPAVNVFKARAKCSPGPPRSPATPSPPQQRRTHAAGAMRAASPALLNVSWRSGEMSLLSPPTTPPHLHAVHAPVVSGRVDVPALPRDVASFADRVLSPLSDGCPALPVISLGSNLSTSASSLSGGVGMVSASPHPPMARGAGPSTSSSTSTVTTMGDASPAAERDVVRVRGEEGQPWEQSAASAGAAGGGGDAPFLSFPSSTSSSSSSSSSSSESSSQSDTFCQLRTRSHAQAEHHRDETTGQRWVSTLIEVEELPSGVRRVAQTLDCVTSCSVADAESATASIVVGAAAAQREGAAARSSHRSPLNTLSLSDMLQAGISSSGSSSSTTRGRRSPLDIDGNDEDEQQDEEAEDEEKISASPPHCGLERRTTQPMVSSPAYLLPGLAATYLAATETRKTTAAAAAAAAAVVVGSRGSRSFGLQSPVPPAPSLSGRAMHDNSPLGWEDDGASLGEGDEEEEEEDTAMLRKTVLPSEGASQLTEQQRQPSPSASALLRGFGLFQPGAAPVASSLMDSFNIRVVDVGALSPGRPTAPRVKSSPLTAVTPAVPPPHASPTAAPPPVFPVAVAPLDATSVVFASVTAVPSSASTSSSSSSGASGCPLSPRATADAAGPLGLSLEERCRDSTSVLGGGSLVRGTSGHAFLTSVLEVPIPESSTTSTITWSPVPLVARSPLAMSASAAARGSAGGGGGNGDDPLADGDDVAGRGWPDVRVNTTRPCLSDAFQPIHTNGNALTPPPHAAAEGEEEEAKAARCCSGAGGLSLTTASSSGGNSDNIPLSMRSDDAETAAGVRLYDSGTKQGSRISASTPLSEPFVTNVHASGQLLNSMSAPGFDAGAYGPLGIGKGSPRPRASIPQLSAPTPATSVATASISNGLSVAGRQQRRRSSGVCGAGAGDAPGGGAEAECFIASLPLAPVATSLTSGASILEHGLSTSAASTDPLVPLPLPLPTVSAGTDASGGAAPVPSKTLLARGGAGKGDVHGAAASPAAAAASGRARARFSSAARSPVSAPPFELPPPPPPPPPVTSSSTCMLLATPSVDGGRALAGIWPERCVACDADAENNPLAP